MSGTNDMGSSKRPLEAISCDNPAQTKKSRGETMQIGSDARELEEVVIVDVADDIGLTQPNVRIEVRWELSFDVDDNGEGDQPNVAASADNQESSSKSVTKVWWGGILLKADGRTYKIQDGSEEVTVPIRSIDYDPRPPDFPSRSIEDVCFLSNHSLLNIESNTKTCWRLKGSQWEQPTDDEEEEIMKGPNQDEGEGDDDEISVTSTSQEEGLRTVLDNILKSALQSSGVMEKMKTMERNQQSIMADRIARTKENLVAKLLGKLNENDGENVVKVVTPELIKTVMSELGSELKIG